MQCEALAKHIDVCIFIYYGIRYAQLTNLGGVSACLQGEA